MLTFHLQEIFIKIARSTLLQNLSTLFDVIAYNILHLKFIFNQIQTVKRTVRWYDYFTYCSLV